jgi:hypothetical protein
MAGVARADTDPTEYAVDQLAKSMAPDMGRVGGFYHNVGKRTDFVTTLQQGKCYFLSGVGGPGVKKLSLYLWDPTNKRVSDNKSHTQNAGINYCPETTGSFKFQGKIEGGDGPFAIGIYAKGAPKVAMAPPPPPPPAPVAAPPPAEVPCVDDGGGGDGHAVFTCDGKAMDVTFDGQFIQHNPGEMPIRVNNANAGCHRVKVDCWTGVFKHGVVYDGPVKVRAGGENRYYAHAGVLTVSGFTDLQPATPPPPQFSRDQLDDASDALKDAIDMTRDSGCSDRVAGKLESLLDLVKDLGGGSGDINRVYSKLDDTQGMINDTCSRRERDSLSRKLSKVSRSLGRR